MLKARVITAIVLVLGFLAALFGLPAAGWLGFAALVCGLGAHEWAVMLRFKKSACWIYSLLLAALCGAFGVQAGLHNEATVAPFNLAPVYGVSVLFWAACVPLWLRARWTVPNPATAALVGLILLLPPCLAIAHLRLLSPWLLLGVMAAVWMADIAAYFTGRAFGKRKLAPNISPGKSWEGAYGACVGVSLYGLVCLGLVGHGQASLLHYLLAVPVLLAFTGLSIIGDLFESMIKRQVGVKDSGKLLPGHGGILDRIDSLTSTLPLVALAVLWFAI